VVQPLDNHTSFTSAYTNRPTSVTQNAALPLTFTLTRLANMHRLGSKFDFCSGIIFVLFKYIFLPATFMQDRLRQQLYEVVPLSLGRLPALTDEPDLPLIQAFIHEAMRYKTLNPLLQHATLNDTEVGGCFIPANTMVCRLIMMFVIQGRLHYINDGANAPWKRGRFCRNLWGNA